MPGTFDFHAKNCFLTYPQCNYDPEQCLDHLRTLLGDKPTYIVVAHELHADGGDHLHALICFRRKFRKRDERFFDLVRERTGESPAVRWHPNIQSPRNTADVFKYVRKGGVFFEWGEPPSSVLPSDERGLSKRDAAFAAIDAETTTVEDFMSHLRERHPYEFFTRGNQIRANVESVKRKRWDYEPEHTEFRIPGAIQDWLDMEFEKEVSVRCGRLRALGGRVLRTILRSLSVTAPVI